MKPTYTPNFVNNPDDVFNHLLTLPWLKIKETRLEYFMSPYPGTYTYGIGKFAQEYTPSPYTPTVQAIQDELNRSMIADFNVCFLNRYDHQQHWLGWHADDSTTMDGDHPIAVISFGAEREIWWKHKDTTGVTPPDHRQKLGHGSLFVMPAKFQDDHLHRIPKADRVVGTRISLTFRRFVAK